MQTQNQFSIIYASQTGQAKAIAESLFDLAQNKGFLVKIFCISKFDKEFKLDEMKEPVVFITSTTGDGEQPETAIRCWNKLKRLNSQNNPNHLGNLKFALLGLGDSNYTQFANGPKSLYNKFIELGAVCFFGPFYADDGTNLEIVVEPFKEKIWSILDEYFGVKTEQKNAESRELEQANKEFSSLNIVFSLPLLAEKHLSIEFCNSKANIEANSHLVNFFLDYYLINELYEAEISEVKVLTALDSVKDCYGIKFLYSNFHSKSKFLGDQAKLDFDYEAGESVNIIVPNSDYEVLTLLKRLNFDLINENIKIKSSKKNNLANLSSEHDLSMHFLFSYCLDIRNGSIKKGLLRMLSEYCLDKKDKTKLQELSSKEGSEQFQNLKENSISLLDLLNKFKSCQPPIDYLIQLLVPLQPRPYSFCSKNKSQNMEIVFNLIEFEQNNERTYSRNGVATGYLSELHAGKKIFFFKRKFQSFYFPNDEELTVKPLILIGSGTGIAPFVSFLRSKAEKTEILNNVLLFLGIRDSNKDFLFKDELCNFYSKYLKHFSVSYSRSLEGAQYNYSKSKYVYESLNHFSAEISKLVYEKNAYIYVCGGTKMSKDVFNALAKSLNEEMKMNIEDSEKYLLEMVKNKRYKQDIWA